METQTIELNVSFVETRITKKGEKYGVINGRSGNGDVRISYFKDNPNTATADTLRPGQDAQIRVTQEGNYLNLDKEPEAIKVITSTAKLQAPAESNVKQQARVVEEALKEAVAILQRNKKELQELGESVPISTELLNSLTGLIAIGAAKMRN
jgi:hypothetical protein